jgi:hypothetical protein
MHILAQLSNKNASASQTCRHRSVIPGDTASSGGVVERSARTEMVVDESGKHRKVNDGSASAYSSTQTHSTSTVYPYAQNDSPTPVQCCPALDYHTRRIMRFKELTFSLPSISTPSIRVESTTGSGPHPQARRITKLLLPLLQVRNLNTLHAALRLVGKFSIIAYAWITLIF